MAWIGGEFIAFLCGAAVGTALMWASVVRKAPKPARDGDFPSAEDRRIFAARAYPNFGVTPEQPLGAPFVKKRHTE